MVRVPTYDGPQQQLAPVPVAPVNLRARENITAQEIDSGIAGQIQRGTQVAQGVALKFFEEERRKARQIRQNALRNQYEEELTGEMTTWSTREGINAQDNIDEHRAWHAKKVAELAKYLSADEQEVFNQWAEGRRVGVNRSLSIRAAAEGKKYDAEQFEIRERQLLNNVADNFFDPVEQGYALAEAMINLDEYAERTGMSAEEVAERKAIYKSSAVEVTIRRHLAEGNDLLAREVFENNQDELLEKTEAELGKLVQASSSESEAARIADEVFRRLEAEEIKPTEAAALLKDMAGDDVGIRDSATSRLNRQRADWERATAEELSDKVENAYVAIIEGGIDAVPKELALDLMANHPKDWMYLRSEADKLSAGTPRVTQAAAWDDYVNMVTHKPKEFAGKTMSQLRQQYGQYMDEKDFRKVQEAWRSINEDEANENGSEVTRSHMTIRELVRDSMIMNKLDPSNKGLRSEKNADVYRQLNQLLAVETEKAAKEGRELTFAEQDQIIGRYFETRNTLTAEGMRSFAFRIDQVPQAMQSMIKADYVNQTGSNPSPQTIIDTYNNDLRTGQLDERMKKAIELFGEVE